MLRLCLVVVNQVLAAVGLGSAAPLLLKLGSGLFPQVQVVAHVLDTEDLLALVCVALFSSHLCHLEVGHDLRVILPALLGQIDSDVLFAPDCDDAVRLHHVKLLLPERLHLLLDKRLDHLLLRSRVHEDSRAILLSIVRHLPLALKVVRELLLRLIVRYIRGSGWHWWHRILLRAHELVIWLVKLMMVLLLMVVERLIARLVHEIVSTLHLLLTSLAVEVRLVFQLGHPVREGTLASVGAVALGEVSTQFSFVVTTILLRDKLIALHVVAASRVVGSLTAH